MKTLIFFSLFILCFIRVYSQSTLPLRADTVVIEKVGGNANLKLKDERRDSIGGILTNMGGGLYKAHKPRKLNDTTLIIGLDTFTVGSGGGGSVTAGYGINVTGSEVKVDTTVMDNRYFNGVRLTRFGAVGDSITDNTAAIQAAINYTWARGGGTIIVPDGYFTVSGPILPTVNGRECNCQLYIPYSPSDSARVIRFVAENYVDFEVIGIDGMPVSKKGAIIASSLIGQADSTFILGVLKGPGSGTFTKMNQTTPIIEGVGFRTRLDAGANGLGCFNFKYASKFKLDNVKLDINVPLFNMPDISASGSVAMLSPERGNHAMLEIGVLRIVGYHLGMDIQEHTVAQDLQIVGCHIGATFEGGDHSSSIQTFEAEFNNINLQVAATGVLWISNFNTEHYTATDQWVEFVSDINYVGGATAEVSIGAYSASQSVSGTRQYLPTTNEPEYVNCLNCKFSFMPIGQFASTMLGENPAVPGTGRIEINNPLDVEDSRRFWMANNSGHVVGAYVSDDGGTVGKVFDINQNGFNPGLVNWMASTFRIGSVYSGSASDAKVEITTPDDVGLRINMSKTTDAVLSVNFNRASTSVQNAFTWSTNATNKWFVGQDNNTTENLYLYGYTANKFVATLYDATADIGFGNTGTDLYIKNGTSVLVNTSTDNGTGAKLQVNGDATVADEAYDATAWNGSLEVPTKNAIRDKLESLSFSNFANADLRFTGNRTHSAAGNNLTIDSLNVFSTTSRGLAASFFKRTARIRTDAGISSDLSDHVNIGSYYQKADGITDSIVMQNVFNGATGARLEYTNESLNQISRFSVYKQAAKIIADSVYISAIPAATADTVYARGAFDAASKTAPVLAIPMVKILKGTTNWTPGSVSAGSSASTTVAVTGAAVGDPVSVCKNVGYSNGEIYDAFVSAPGVVTIRVHNVSTGSANYSTAADYNVIVHKY